MGGMVSSLGSVIGTNGNDGNNWQAKQANVLSPWGSRNVSNASNLAYGQAQNSGAIANEADKQNGLAKQGDAYGQQQAFVNALGGLNGAGAMQGAMANNNALGAQMAQNNGAGIQGAAAGSAAGLNNQFAHQNGVGNQSNTFNQMQGLSNQYQNIANGRGPNPAAAMLANQTGNNMQQQAALMASQRGSGANAGLMARQIGQQGAGIQQNAVGQAAQMQANQQLAALGAMQGQQQMMGNTAAQQIAQQQAQQQMLGNMGTGMVGQQLQGNALSGNLANAAIGAQQAGLNSAASQAASIAGNQLKAHEDSNSAAEGYLANVNAGVAAQNNANIANANQYNQAMSPIEKQKAGNQSNFIAGLGDKLSGPAGSLLGKIPGFGGGNGPTESPTGAAPSGDQFTSPSIPMGGTGPDPTSTQNMGTSDLPASGSYAARGGIAHNGTVEHAGPLQPENGPRSYAGKKRAGMPMMASGGKTKPVPAMVSPGEKYLSPKDVKRVEKGADPMSAGKTIPGKASVKGDSLKNDTVPKTLEEGGIVLPRSVTQSKNPHWAAHKFVSALMASGKLKG